MNRRVDAKNKYGRPDYSTASASTVAAASSAAAAAAPAKSAAAASPADTTQLVSDDIINMIATFGTCRDMCILGRVCRRFSPLPFHDDLWELRALDILPSPQQLRSAMAELKLNSCRQLVEAFTRIGIPSGVLGFWQAEAPTLSLAAHMELSAGLPPNASPPGGGADGAPSVQELEARGELLRITLEAGGFLCESVAANGACRRIFTIRVSTAPNGKVKIGFFSREKESSLSFGGDDEDGGGGGGGGWVPGDSMAEAKARYTFAVPGSTERAPIRPSGARAFLLEREDGRTCRYVKLTPPAPPSSCRKHPTCATSCASASSSRSPEMAAAVVEGAPAPAAAAQGLCGLWCAPYGSHGLEIIQLSTDPSCASRAGGVGAETAAAAAAAAKCSPSWSRGGGGAGSCSGVSTSMTDGTESVCTSAPATETGSEAGFCCGECDSDNESELSDLCPRAAAAATSTRKRGAEHAAAPAARGGDDDDDDDDDDDGADTPSQLFGFKVTGDDNVPAGKTSFVIDLKTKFDVDEELQSDSRPVVMFLPTGAVMANLANRREHIASWCKGGGQINRVPGRWLPEWVDVEFVEYHAGYRCAFSVIFRQPAQAVRVVMDFERAPGCKEWPQWCAHSHGVSGGDSALNATTASSTAASTEVGV